jgi:glutathione-regulated potassium-efflux system protein KefB
VSAELAATAEQSVDLAQVVVLLAAGVVAVPIFKRLGLGSVLGYLAAGLVIGPSGLGLFADTHAILHTAELGVVMFLFIIGLEMEPEKLWALRKQIFGLGVIQVSAAGALVTLAGMLFGFSFWEAFVFGIGFVLTSTAIVMQVLSERGEVTTPAGEKIVSILLLEDLAIVPLLAIVAVAAPSSEEPSPRHWITLGLGLGAVLLVVAVGRWILNPVFRILANSGAREVMTAAALLVVFGAAFIMELGGLSMAMGAFLAGVLLSRSSFRHQLEADVEPFRGILLGLFFIAVGMSLELEVVRDDWLVLTRSVLLYMLLKAVAIYAVARATRTRHDEALDRAVLMSQGGEFAFVLYTTAESTGVISGKMSALFTATVIVSMVLTPLMLIALKRLRPEPSISLDGVQVASGLRGRVLIIGFGRFGQIASQGLLAKHCSVSIIDTDPDMIRAAEHLGFRIHYGDGTRLDILHAAGAQRADAVLVCVDKQESTNKIVELLRGEFPLVKVLARAFDRGHAIHLIQAGVDYQVRETFESALAFGEEALIQLGAEPEVAASVMSDVRERDRKRFELQTLSGIDAGNDLLFSNAEEQAREQGLEGVKSRPEHEPLPS